MTSARQIDANRLNAQKSTGPRSANGKAVSRANALKHGVLATVALAPDEERAAFEALLDDLIADLAPMGPLEEALVEKIAVALWRNRRLAAAEAAAIALQRRPERLLERVSRETGQPYLRPVTPDDLEPPDAETVAHHQALLAELDLLDVDDFEAWPDRAPTLLARLQEETAEDGYASPAEFLAEEFEDGVAGFVSWIKEWSEAVVRHAAEQPALAALAQAAHQAALALPMAEQHLVARYQTMIDNQVFKTLKALREAQAARARTIGAEAIGE